MPNIEIKAKCHDLKIARNLADLLKTEYVGSLHQVDTYFTTEKGRLKLREINGKESQLIPYYKDYSKGPMKSNYSVLTVRDAQNTKDILEKILGIVTVVDKIREVFLIDNIRIHLDQVKKLGSFIEFEAVYDENSAEDKKREIEKIESLMKDFRIEEEDLLDRSYVDYLLDGKKDLEDLEIKKSLTDC